MAIRRAATIKNVCVFAGSRFGARPEYLVQAQALGRALATRGIGLVYGGASVGLMGALTDAALAEGGKVVGVMPQRLVDREIAHPGLTELRVVPSMHERKALMERLSDAFIALPGGFGTFEELLEIVTWFQLGLHQKPMGVLNVENYFSPLMALVERGVYEGFIPEFHRGLIMTEDTPEPLLERILDFVPPPSPGPSLSRQET